MSTNIPDHSRETPTHCFDVTSQRGLNMTVSRRITSDINVITEGQLPPALRHSCRPRLVAVEKLGGLNPPRIDQTRAKLIH